MTCIFVGYLEEHPEGTFLCYDPITDGTHKSRDVTWLHRMYYSEATVVHEIQTVVTSENTVENPSSISSEEL